jgi:hypothetical protein
MPSNFATQCKSGQQHVSGMLRSTIRRWEETGFS